MSSNLLKDDFKVISPDVTYSGTHIHAKCVYTTNRVTGNKVVPCSQIYEMRTDRRVPKLGLMLVGWGGNNGSTITAGVLANKLNIKWMTKEGEKNPNYFGSLTQASTIRLGSDTDGKDVYIPFKNILPMVDPNDIVIGGWDISSVNLGKALGRSQVLDYDLQQKVMPYMEDMVPLPSLYYKDFIAANQSDRADNVLIGTKQQNLDDIRGHIRNFKEANRLDKIIVLWTANTERYSAIQIGVNDNADNLLAAIARGDEEVSPSTIFACASILEDCSYINGSPQNTFVPGVVELAERRNIFIAGDDFKSGQTKMKSVLVDFLVSAGIKPVSIVSYNHLGNNDGKNLSAPEQFRSKEISKSNVVDDIVASNRILYGEDEHPDHCVVIKYVPYVSDSKRAMDEYTSEIFLNGRNTIVMHNTCEDSLLATPLILDLTILCELCERITIKRISPHHTASESGMVSTDNADLGYERFHCVLSILSYLLKAPMVPQGTPVINALAAQRQCLVNILKACVGLKPDDYMMLEHKLPSSIRERQLEFKEANTNSMPISIETPVILSTSEASISEKLISPKAHESHYSSIDTGDACNPLKRAKAVK